MLKHRLTCLIFTALFVAIALPRAGFAISEMDVRKAFIHETLLKCYLAKRLLPEAQREYKAVLLYKPNDARMHFDYGNCMLTMQNKAGAAVQFGLAAKIQPGVPEYWAAVGAVEMMLKNYAAAVAAYTKAVSLGGNYRTELQRAEYYLQQQREEQARQKQLKLQNEENKKIKDDDD
jgi:tetratricopeptide (TPR) repeat protein